VTSFDAVVIAVLTLSTLLAFARGVVRELIALVAWVAGIAGALALTPLVGGWLPEFGGFPWLRYLIAFTAIVIGALVAGAMVAWPLSRAIRAAGLGFVDRFLGGVFGLARGLLLVLAFALVAGLTGVPRTDWWQNASLAGPLAVAALALKPWLPRALADGLDYSREGAQKAPAPKLRKA
jgi:membrane protein required for colicin V production